MLNQDTQGKIRIGTRSSVPTPPVNEVVLVADLTSKHLCQKDSNGKIIDLAAVTGQQDSVGFDTTVRWDFDSTDEGWTATNGTVAFDTANGKGLLITDNNSTVQTIAVSPTGLSIDGNLYRRVKISVTLATLPAPTTSVVPEIRYVTGGHSFSASFRKIISYPVPFAAVGDTAILDFDMETATGAPDWYAPPNNTITRIEFLLTDAVPTGTEIRINWIAVGRNHPTKLSTSAGTGDVTQSANSASSGLLKISAGADKSITDYSGTSSLLKVDGSSLVANAVSGTDYFPPATNASVDNGDIILEDSASPVTPALGALKLIAQSEAGLSAFRTVNREGQNWRVRMEGRFAARFQATAGSAVLTGHTGILFAATGTATAAAASFTSRYTRTSKVEALVTVEATTAVAGFRSSNALIFTGSGTVDGGYWVRLIAGPSTGVTTATSRFWMGTGQTAAPTDVEPSTVNNILGVGYDAADANFFVMTKGGGAVTKTDTGIAIPTTDRSGLYEVIIYQPPGATQEAYIQFTNLINGTTFSKTETTAGNLPNSGVSLTPKVYSSVGGTSSVIGVALHSCFITSDF